jgi:outer membrane protein|tara:strand:+ start:220 stop:756 length:537 start_codon:yes stop_codon:yes gene_type:complete
MRKSFFLKNIYFKIAVVLLSLFCLTSSAFGAGTRVGFINLQKAVSSTKEWKKQLSVFNKSYQKEQNLISTKQKKIKSMYEEITKQGFVLDPTLKKSKEERFRKEQVDFERYVQDKKEEFGRKEKEITEKIFTKMIKVVRKIGSEKKFSVIMDEKTLLYSDSALDISNIAVKTYDRIYK